MDEVDSQARRKARRVGQSQPRSAGSVDKRPLSDQEDRPKKRRLTFRVIEDALAFLVMLYVCFFFGAQDPVLRVNVTLSTLRVISGEKKKGIATRDQWSKLCKCSPGTMVLCTDSSAALGFVKRKGSSRRTRHVDTKVYFMQAWAMEPGQRILKVHGNSQQVADCLTKIMTPQAAHRRALGL